MTSMHGIVAMEHNVLPGPVSSDRIADPDAPVTGTATQPGQGLSIVVSVVTSPLVVVTATRPPCLPASHSLNSDAEMG